jgi:hypothetical protein
VSIILHTHEIITAVQVILAAFAFMQFRLARNLYFEMEYDPQWVQA